MEKAIDAVFRAIGSNPWLIAIFAIFILFLHYGPAYITAISNALSQRRRDNAELLEKEAEIRAKILALKQKEKDNG